MLLVLWDKYHLEVHLGSHVSEHDALRVETFEFHRGDTLLFASMPRHRGLVAPPGVGKQVVLFRFLTPHERHKLVDVEWFILDPLLGGKEKLVHGCGEAGRCPTLGLSPIGGVTLPSTRACGARLACRGTSSWMIG